MRTGRGIDRALAAFKLAAAANPKMVNAHVAIIGIEVSRGRLDLAQQQLQAFRQALPQHPQVLYTAAQLAYIAADYPKARDALTQLLKGYPDVAALRAFAGVTQFKLGQVLQAESNLAKAVQLEPKLALAREYLARVYLRMGQPDRALVVLAPLIGPGRSSPEALAVAGQAHLLSGQFARAEAMFAEALKIKPDDSAVQTSAALALGQGRSERAAQPASGL
ncbi:MAG: tetratricopeptide repeat protein [Rhodocyclaceae bacterium]|nr:tetratricopeptide repeat protein [Rhodocyclaceae bacterium]